tara:strand:- start:2795 stop:3274 length:480 start_codon:yes stop_codon:yes gene_type:complete
MSILEKEPVKRAIKSIKKFDESINVLKLNTSARTANDAASSLKCEVGAIVKSLLFRTNDSFILCLIAGDKRCSLNQLKKITLKKNVSMASAEEVKSQTGYTIGGVSPVGHINQIEVLIDRSLERFKNIFAAAGHPNCVFKINYNDLIRMTNAKIHNLVE